jgi:chromosome segregation ATPase
MLRQKSSWTMDEIVEKLQNYGEAISRQAIFRVRWDALERRLRDKKAEYDKCRKHHPQFKFLEAQQNNDMNNLQRQRQLMKASNGEQQAILSRLQKELGAYWVKAYQDCGDLMHMAVSVKKELDDHKVNHQIDIASLKDQMDKRIGEIQRAANAAMQRNESRVDKKVEDLPNLRLQVTKLMNDLNKIQPEQSKARLQLSKITASLDTFKQVLDGVHGEDGQPSQKPLLETIAALEKENRRFRKGMEKAQEAADEHDNEISSLKDRLELLENSKQDNPPITPGQDVIAKMSGSLDPALTDLILSLQAKVEANAEGLAAFQAEQEDKDGEVASDSERIQAELRMLREELEKTGQSIKTLTTKIDTLPLALPQPDAMDLSASANEAFLSKTASGTYGGTNGHPKVEDELKEEFQSIKSKVSELDQFTEGFRMMLNNLDDRFNNLTNEHIVRLMVAEMKKIYPEASSIQSSFNQINQTLHNLNNSFQHLGARVHQLAVHIPGLQQNVGGHH